MVDSLTQKVIHIDFPPQYNKEPSPDPTLPPTLSKLSSGTTVSPPLDSDSFDSAKRARLNPPTIKHDFLPDLIAENKKEEGKEWKQRDDIKPLHVLQPEGVSFKVDGHVIEWQKWKMHVGELPISCLPSDLCLIFEQRSTIARVSHCLPSLTTTMASFGLSSTACLSRRW